VRIEIGRGAAAGNVKKRAAPTMAMVRRHANIRTRPVIPTPPKGEAVRATRFALLNVSADES